GRGQHHQADPARMPDTLERDERQQKRRDARQENAEQQDQPEDRGESDSRQVELPLLGHLAEQQRRRPAEGGVKDLTERPEDGREHELDDCHDSPPWGVNRRAQQELPWWWRGRSRYRRTDS